MALLRMRRREFLKLGGTSLVVAGLYPRNLLSINPSLRSSPSLLREQLLNEEFPFPYDDQYFACAERVYNVRRDSEDVTSWEAEVNLCPKEGRKLDVKVLVSDSREGLSSPQETHAFYSVENSLDITIRGYDSPRLYYQVQYREGQESWKALSPKSFKLPNTNLEKGGEIKVILIGDDHTFDDADYKVPDSYKGIKLSGDYVNEFLKKLRNNPNWVPDYPLSVLKNGFNLAKAIIHIMAYEDPDLLINLGDTNGIGANYRWRDWGLPHENLTEQDYDYICKTLWMRMRKLYSALTPHMPVLIALGNHDGEEGWNSARFKAREWRNKLFPLPTEKNHPEGGHPDGNYYALSLGSDEENRGGAQFIFLDVTAFTGSVAPSHPEKWTLGKEQLSWLESVLDKNERDWSFACFHHVLGGWPAGPGETDSTPISYGRGPLFNYSDYSGFCNPNNVEQVKITEMAKKYGLRGFLYGHDHIFYVKKIGKGLNDKEILGICCGSPKYIGEQGWWKGSLWMKYYGQAFKSNPDFWGPPGITRLTVKNGEARMDYVVIAQTSYSNLPSTAKPGTILSSTVLASPPPSISLDRTEITLQGIEGKCRFPPQVFRVRNAGGMALNFQAKTKQSWLSASPERGKSWGKWKDINLSVNVKNFQAGNYEGILSIECPEASNSPQQLRVKVVILDPPIYPPVNFIGERKVYQMFYYPSSVILLSWMANRLNQNIQKYRVYSVKEQGERILLKEVSANNFSYTFKNAQLNERYRFALTAVDKKNREGEAAYATVN